MSGKKKQDYIYKQEKRAVVMQRWYLVKLIEEYVRSLEFSKLTMDLCKKCDDMEKERQFKEQGTPNNNPILSVSAL